MKVNLAAQVSIHVELFNSLVQVLSETVTSALQVLNRDDTVETRHFIRMMDYFFDCLNVKSPRQGILERKEYCHPYSSPSDQRFKVLPLTPSHIHMRAQVATHVTNANTHTDTLQSCITVVDLNDFPTHSG